MKIEAEIHNLFAEKHISDDEEEQCKATASKRYTVRMVVSGRSVSFGTATGRASVVMDRNDIIHVKEGAVIVSITASPHLAMVMSRACAIATEYGGQGAAASGFARKYGIPAVVGVPGLMKLIKDGDLVRVDGTKGTVEIMKLSA